MKRYQTILIVSGLVASLSGCYAPRNDYTAEQYCSDYMGKRVGTDDYSHCVNDERSRRGDQAYYNGTTYPGDYARTGYPVRETVVTTTTTAPVVPVPASGAVVEEHTYYSPYHNPYPY